VIVVDDALLLAVVAEQPAEWAAPFVSAASRGEVFTTGSWYWRLTRALARPGQGALTRALGGLSEAEQRRVGDALEELPPEIGLLSLRRLVPVMATLAGQLNLLTAEAVAAAVLLDASIVVTTESSLLHGAATSAGVEVTVVDPRR
jgi:hypothetical protein